MSSKNITQILHSKVSSLIPQDTQQRFIVARPVMTASAMPSGVTISARPIKGKRMIVKNRRRHANQRLHIAEWPDANLHEITVPKLACITNGTADYLLGKYCVHCGEGNIILIPPCMPHQCRGPFLQNNHLKNGSCSLLHAYAYSRGVLLWLSRSQNEEHTRDYINSYLIPNMSAVKILNLLMEEGVEGKENFEVVGKGLLSSLFSILAQEVADEHYMRTSSPTGHDSPHDANADFAHQVREYLEANCYKPLKLADAAAHMYMSVSQFTRKMRQETGTTFVEMLTTARIERAKELLSETDWTSTAISSLVSFKSSNYFQELFCQRVGCTPTQYRRKFASG